MLATIFALLIALLSGQSVSITPCAVFAETSTPTVAADALPDVCSAPDGGLSFAE
jgi:hypothetical protein